jgi:hypothetical protein
MTDKNVVIQKGNVVSLYFNDLGSGWEKYFLLRSDVHHDSTLCNRDLELEHLKKAKECDAFILDGGDLAEAMQGKFDPRRTYNDLRPEYKGDNYYDLIVNEMVAYYTPYAKQFKLLAKGNHDTSVIRNAGTDIVQRVAGKLNDAGGDCHVGGYGGWVRLMLNRQGEKHSIIIKHFHGFGGEAPVTRGAIQTNRQAVYLPDADIVWNGHNHHEYVIPIARERLSPKGDTFKDLQWHVRTPGYKNDYGDGTEGWSVEKGMVPKPQGAVWLHVRYINHEIKYDLIADVV